MTDIRERMIAEMERRDRERNDWREIEGVSYGLGPAIPPGMELERRKPARDPALTDVATAAGYAVGSFVALLFAGVVLATITRDVNVLKTGVSSDN